MLAGVGLNDLNASISQDASSACQPLKVDIHAPFAISSSWEDVDRLCLVGQGFIG